MLKLSNSSDALYSKPFALKVTDESPSVNVRESPLNAFVVALTKICVLSELRTLPTKSDSVVTA